jgi:hypothetical protein
MRKAAGGDEEAVKAMKTWAEVRNWVETGSNPGAESRALYCGLGPCVKKSVKENMTPE